jgi:hypothetical protein
VLQAQAYFAGARDAALAQAKPVLLYYSFLNLAKALVLTRQVESDIDKAKHGLSEQLRVGGKELVDAYLDAYPASASQKNIFDLFMRALTGSGLSGTVQLPLPNLLPQVVPGHRLWSTAASKPERFIEIDAIALMEDTASKQLWARVQVKSGDLSRFSITHTRALTDSGLGAHCREVRAAAGSVCFESTIPVPFTHRASDEVMTLVDHLAPALWMTVLDNPPYRKHYLYLCPSAENTSKVSQLCSIYAIAYYLGSITRYRPHHFQAILENEYGPFVEAFLNDQPTQFLYLIASEFARREVTRAALA